MVRVDTVPLLLRPFFMLFGYSMGILFYLYVGLMHATCTIRYQGTSLQKHPYVLCIWHHSLIVFFIVFIKMQNQVWMNHPAWYMKPIHVLLHLTGVKKICLGSSGNGGRQALDGVVTFLKQGYSTTVASDGPAGPVQVLKPGVLHMARATGLPVIPLRFVCSRSKRLGRWDKKFVPGFFSTITVQAGAPVFVTETNFEEAEQAITAWLDFK